MAREDAIPDDHPAPGHSLKRKSRVSGQNGKKSSRKKTGPASPETPPECVLIAGEGSCPEWHDILARYPMIDSVQREDFPEHGASFAYLAHFYRSENTTEESARAQKEFEEFFQAIGYRYDSAGNYESRWFEGVGIKIR